MTDLPDEQDTLPDHGNSSVIQQMNAGAGGLAATPEQHSSFTFEAFPTPISNARKRLRSLSSANAIPPLQKRARRHSSLHPITIDETSYIDPGSCTERTQIEFASQYTPFQLSIALDL